MNVTTAYAPISGSRVASPEKAHYFLMNALLYSRVEAGYPTNCERFDEDVNVYLAGILAERISPRGAAGPPPLDAALFEAAERAGGPRPRFELYRASADALLVALGVFRNARGRRPGSAPHLSLPVRAYIGRGKTYYAVAASLAAALHRRPTAVVEVLEKLSRGFERYVDVLSYLGGEYLGIMRGLSTGELYHLERSAASARPRAGIGEAYDRFLDCYSSYRRNPSADAKRSLAAAVERLRELDPSFAFDMESFERVKSL